MENQERQSNSNEGIGKQLLEIFDNESEEYRMVEWLKDGLVNSEIIAARYFHYIEQSRQVNERIHNPYGDEILDYLRSSYCSVVGVFYWSMETHCFNSYPEALTDENCRPDLKDLPEPEFSLDLDKIKKDLIENRGAGLIKAEEYRQRAEHIYGLCERLLAEMEKSVLAYRIPLIMLATTYKNIAFCIKFGGFK